MFSFPPTIILRHKRENLQKCSLRGLEKREDMRFFTYPRDSLPDLAGYFLLSMDGPPLSLSDKNLGLFLLDGTWRYAEKMQRLLASPLPTRSIPPGFTTAYPRRQDDCKDPCRGLASIEALFISYTLLGRDTSSLLDNYHWKDLFLQNNQKLF